MPRDKHRAELKELIRRDAALKDDRARLVADRKATIARAQEAGMSFSEIARILERDRVGLWREVNGLKQRKQAA